MRAGIYALARVPDDVPCPLASHGLDQVKLHREARPAYTRLSIHGSHLPDYTSARPFRYDQLQRRRSPNHTGAQLDHPPRLRQPPLHNQQHQNGFSQKDLVEGPQPEAQEWDRKY